MVNRELHDRGGEAFTFYNLVTILPSLPHFLLPHWGAGGLHFIIIHNDKYDAHFYN
jgi:hypothetical protein